MKKNEDVYHSKLATHTKETQSHSGLAVLMSGHLMFLSKEND